MTEGLASSRRVIGVKQSRRAIADGAAKTAYVASDADDSIRLPLLSLCGEAGVPVIAVETMGELGAACGIEVGASVAVVLKD